MSRGYDAVILELWTLQVMNFLVKWAFDNARFGWDYNCPGSNYNRLMLPGNMSNYVKLNAHLYVSRN